MTTNMRLAGLLCGILASMTVSAQTSFVDDAHRTVTVPRNISRVFAAGAPAEVLLYTLAPEKLVGRNHMPAAGDLEFIPSGFRNPVPISQLPNADDDKADAELIGLRPDIYIDYGDVTADYIGSLNNVQQRTKIPSIIMDGTIDRMPVTYRKVGELLGVKARGELLAAHVERILDRYAGSLQKGAAPRVYLACNADGTSPCLEGERNGEVARILGAINVAGTIEGGARRRSTVADIKMWNPDVIIAANAAAADRIRGDAEWRTINAVANNRVYTPPTAPFNWGPRPPSVNRLAGLMWMAYVLPGRAFDAEYFNDLRSFFADFYHVTPTDEQLRRLSGG